MLNILPLSKVLYSDCLTRSCRSSPDFLEERFSVHTVYSDAGNSPDLIGFFSIQSSRLIKPPEPHLKTTVLAEHRHLLHVSQGRTFLRTNLLSKAVSHYAHLKLSGPSAASSPHPRTSALFCTGFHFAYVVWCGFVVLFELFCFFFFSNITSNLLIL